MDVAALEEVAGELYGLDPDDFMEARTAAVAAARERGDRPTAAAIGKLRRPTRAAWAVNLLSREAADELGELMELGDALAAAQQSLSGAELRRLSAQRNQVVQAVARQAAALAAQREQPLTEATRTEVVNTLQAALADPDVREQVLAGRLDKAQTYSGFGLGLAVGAPPVTPPAEKATKAAKPGKGTRARGKPSTPEDEDALRAERLAQVEAAQAEVEAAERAVAEAVERLSQAETGKAEADERVDAASQEIADLRAELRRAEEAETEARRAATAAADERHDARSAKQQAETALTRAQRALRALLED